MAVTQLLIDSEGNDWDFDTGSVAGSGVGQVVFDGENDAYDGAFLLVVKGLSIDPPDGTLTGRELNSAAVMVGNISVGRSILVSDAGISPVGFARFLESFTNTGASAETITVEIASNLGSDGGTAIQSTSSGDLTLSALDTGFASDDDDLAGADSSLGFAWGDGLGQAPVAASNDTGIIRVEYSITLQPGETKSLLHFGVQNATAAESVADYQLFWQPAGSALGPSFLAGLSASELATVINYAQSSFAASTAIDAATVVPEFISAQSALGLGNHDRNPAVIALADGGYAIVHEILSTSDSTFNGIGLERYTADGVLRSGPDLGGVTVVRGVNSGAADVDPVLTQLTDGRILVAWTQTGAASGNGIKFAIVDVATGAVTTPETLMPNTDGADFAPGIVALSGGGWALVKQDGFSPTDQDADLFVYNSAGVLTALRALNGNSVVDEQKPAVAVLNDGRIAIAYEREKADNTDTFGMAVQIQSADGGTDTLPSFLFDSTGDANFDPDILALPDGGFAVAYADSNDIRVAFFDSAGALRGSATVATTIVVGGTTFSSDDRDPSIALLANGQVALTWHENAGRTRAALIDPVAVARINSEDLIFDEVATTQPSVAVLSNGNFVTAWTDSITEIADGNTDPNGDHVSMQIARWERTRVGDATGETFEGDELVDRVFGNGGNDVFLVASPADFAGDSLDGGDDQDRIRFTSTTAGETLVLSSQVTNVEIAEITEVGSPFGATQLNLDASAVATGMELLGNLGANTITGTEEDDTLNGGAGLDTLNGGGGDDIFIDLRAMFDGDNDVYDGGDGVDTLRHENNWASIVHFDLSAGFVKLNGVNRDQLIDIENLTVGGAARVTGDAKPNVITIFETGSSGDNIIDGGGGVDEMRGGKGDDRYIVSEAGDKAFEKNEVGTDLVESSVTYSLDNQFVENLTLTGGNAIDGLGNSLQNIIRGNDAANLIDGRGGVDEMRGGKGNDRYVVSQLGDKAFELNEVGTDLVESSITYSLDNQFVENLTLTGADAINGLGNSLANIIRGNDAANFIDGKAGVDQMRGGKGNDRYVVSEAGDKAFELNEIGIDTVESSVTYNLNGQFVENLKLTGALAIDGIGNSLDNILLGNDAANLLNGGGGVDEMRGGKGDDRYIVSHAGDKAFEVNEVGTDTVESLIAYNLDNQFIENLTLTGSNGVAGTGNSLANILIGNNAGNTLAGRGGSDALTGAGGNDVFRFDTALGATNIDGINDMNAIGDDTIHLDDAFFANIGPAGAALSSAAFKDLSLGAVDGDDRIVYDKVSGVLSFDRDGSGATFSRITFAEVTPSLTLTSADFFVV